jgi:periplasmic divalent cation tolerance protein
MPTANQTRVVLVTCGSAKEARKIASHIVEKRLAACVNILTGSVQSIYRWKGKVENTREILVVIKTTTNRLPELEKTVASLHSYDVPEFIVLPITAGSRKYLDWVKASVKPAIR